MRAWPRCSFLAEAAGDPREGTAPPAEGWLLIEHPGPWGRDALATSGLGPTTVAALSQWAGAHGARLGLIRRPGRRGRSARVRRWFRVDSRQGHEAIRTGTFETGPGLVAALGAAGDGVAGPLQLVCAHGRHDPCCAVRGRALAATLAADDPAGTWECSHVGGCRFAPVLVLLPHGFTLGGVPTTEAVRIVRAYRAGTIDPRWLRGRSSLPPAAQAAQYHARIATGATGVAALRVVAVHRVGAAGWRVALADPDCTVSLRERHLPAGRPLTCAATSDGWLRQFDLLDLRSG
ncbi:sucrase ferredoxin [Actinocatenispora thailandica]|uniref:Sucrase ferredoxin n=1 Tax=Actinocatenispora thailandica TaxID=227318 RepID=A0A7R7DRW5_9ACTN|nr:sucrase ferredoxin [Actinocatenispora thailandica]BCJ36407.1 sucrase ferredoxin [Actinocatenispora thailandica]